MEIMEIKFAGFIKKGQHLPETFATISRVPGNKDICMLLLSCENNSVFSLT